MNHSFRIVSTSFVAALALAGCATSNDQAADAPPPASAAAPNSAPAEGPRWLVGYVWPAMDDGPLLAAARQVLTECAIDRAAGLEGVQLAAAPRGWLAIAPDGAEKLALDVTTPADRPAAREMRLRWADGVGPEGRVAVLAGVQKVMAGQAPCPSSG